ncbi:MAG: glycosyltransferase [Aphanothece sp. CMT-3BRIN-NPC111]|jgi:glycosyltransferase involved in cell wall biosynthesis|nr:glycosyltransferase [Aphanothece sp. CMT-3BRIN-NPC111]
MRILSVHNYYQIRGGEDESCEAEKQLLQERGHQVEVYEKNNDSLAALSSARLAFNTIWSAESYANLRQRFRKLPHDVVHVQNFFPLISPSVYYAAKAEGVPVVQTLRNYRLLCPNALFFRDGGVCEDCLGQPIPWPGVVHNCYRQSRVASAGVATMLTVHRTLRTWSQMVDVYIALTEFARQKFIQGGIPAEKIVVKPNFIHPDPGSGTGGGGYALYVGRLSVEKGIDTLLAAWERLQGKIPLKIVGEGPLANQVVEATARSPQIEWLGRRPMAEVYDLIGEAKVLVFPSKWYETFGRVAVEAFAKGTPVIAANIGAIAELIENDRTGIHFQPGDPDDLAAKVEWVLSHPDALAQMRREVRAEFEARYTADENYRRLMEIYALVRRV